MRFPRHIFCTEAGEAVRGAVRRLALLTTLVSFAFLLVSGPASAAAPLYDVKATWGPTNLPPGGKGQFEIQARNVSEETGKTKLTIADRLPEGVKVTEIRWLRGVKPVPGTCSHEEAPPASKAETVSCVLGAAQVPKYAPGRGVRLGSFGEYSASPSGYLGTIEVEVEIGIGAEGTAANKALLYGGEGALAGGGVCAQTKVKLEEGLPPCAEDEDQVPFGATPSAFGLVPGSFEADLFDAEYPTGKPSRRAGAHPFELRFNFDLRTRTVMGREWTIVASDAPLKTAEATLPRGVIGNPEALPKCDPIRFAEEGSTKDSTGCPANTQVGYVNVAFPGNGGVVGYEVPPNSVLSGVPLYSLTPPRGQVADFAFSGAGLVQAHIYPVLAPSPRGYVIKSVVPDISDAVLPRGSEATFWGVPADPAHDAHRYYPEAQPTGEKDTEGHEIRLAAGAPFEGPIRPFFTNPMDCGTENGAGKLSLESYIDPGNFTKPEEYGSPDNVTGCNNPRFRFEPQLKLAPTDQHAGAATGLKVNLEVPQQNDEVKEARELYEGSEKLEAFPTPPLKKAVVTLPEGMTVNPSAAQGLAACSLAQIGISAEGVPNEEPVSCPDDSQYGTLTLHTPLLPETVPVKGRIYIAQPYANPFGTFLAFYLVFEDPSQGILVKIPGKVELDEATGRVTTSFEGLPQVPMSDMEMTIKSGVRAGLVEPQTCGEKTIEATFYTWQDPSTPHPFNSSYDITERPDGSPCVNNPSERPFDPQLSAGTLNPIAGAFSPLALRMTRTDEDQEFSKVEGTAPPGLTASLAGVTSCSQAQIEAAQAPGRSGTEEIESPSCPASSQVGTVDAGAGVGQALTYVKGKVYLAGPYEGAPVSGVAIVPAVAGPFDLGTVVTRAPAYVNPETAQITLKTDPLSQIFKGVPLRTRDIRVHLDRPNFTLNPTSCEEMHFTGTLFSTEGKSKAASNRFQAADCANLGFAPKLSLKLKGGIRRAAHPALQAVLKMPAGGANIAGAQVTLPHSEFLDQGHLNNICTRVQFAAKECPAASIYGHAVAKTPLFDQSLEGPVYLRSSSHHLPDLVAALKGPASQPVEVDLDGRIDSVHGGIRSSFEVVPDAPVETFTLTMRGGRKGLLVNSENLCAKTNRATARFSAQNGRAITLHPVMRSGCGRHPRKPSAHKKHRKR